MHAVCWGAVVVNPCVKTCTSPEVTMRLQKQVAKVFRRKLGRLPQAPRFVDLGGKASHGTQ